MGKNTKQMLPTLDEERNIPVVFYFLPSHFSDDTIGFAVLQTAMDAKRSADEVSTLWLRNVNNSLQMVRIVSKLLDYSLHDPMTSLYNRRGMEITYNQRKDSLEPEDTVLIWIIDMDGLKYINDHFGHEHGDVGIITVSEAIRTISEKDDISARIGGDEFVILTDSSDENYARNIGEDILGHNEEVILWEGKEIPLSLYVRIVRYEGGTALRYSEFFTMLHNELSEERKRQNG